MTELAGSPEYSSVGAPRPERPEFADVYRDEFAFVYRILRYLGARGADIEDLAHDVFVIVHRRLADYDPGRPLQPWLFGIAYRVVRRERERRASRSEVADTSTDLRSPAPRADDQVAAWQAWALVEAALERLPLEQRAVLILHDIEEQTAPEIAAELEVPLNTVYSRLRLARERFAAAIARMRGADR